MSQYVYILQVREFVATGQNIYKIGKSKQPNLCRVNNYPKFSVLIMQTLCIDCDILEKQIIKLFNEKYKRHKDYGNEYYEGNLISMVADINQLVSIQFAEYMNGSNGVFKIQYKKDTNIPELVKEVKKTKAEKEKEEKKEHKEVNVNKNDKILARTCPKCKKVFNFPSILKKHIQNSFHCLMPEDEIDKYISDNKVFANTNNKIYTCNKCNKIFGYKHTLERHKENTKCGKSQKNINNIEENNSTECIEEDNDDKKIIKINKKFISERKCPNDECNYLFKYPSGLKRHFQISVRCHKTEDEIKNFFLEIEKQKSNKSLECNICKQSFSSKSNLIRHEKQHIKKNNSLSNIDLNILKNNKTKLLEILNKL